MRLFKRTKHTSEDRISLQIAEQYGVGEGYIRSRKQGMSPREAGLFCVYMQEINTLRKNKIVQDI